MAGSDGRDVRVLVCRKTQTAVTGEIVEDYAALTDPAAVRPRLGFGLGPAPAVRMPSRRRGGSGRRQTTLPQTRSDRRGSGRRVQCEESWVYPRWWLSACLAAVSAVTRTPGMT
jgi:hypothetical protein